MVMDASTAREFVDAWLDVHGPTSAMAQRFLRVAQEQRVISAMCGDRLPLQAQGHLEAVRVLEAAATRILARLESKDVD